MYTMSGIHECCKGNRMDRIKHTHQMLIGYSLSPELQLLVIEVYGKGRFSWVGEGWKTFRWGASHMQYAILDGFRRGMKWQTKVCQGGKVTF